jgi:predicted MFS family arabinose efflux permease
VLGVPAVANACVALSLGRIRRHVARRHLLVAASALFAAGLIAIAGSSPLWGLVAGLVVFGLGEGLMVPNLQDIATSAAPPGQRGTSVAVFVSGARTGQTVGPLGAGALFAAAGAPTSFLAGAVIAVLLSAALSIFLRRHRDDTI